MSLFDIDHKRLYLQLLPVMLRKPVLVAFLYVLIYPVIANYQRLLRFRNLIILRIRRNGQVCYLRGMLNDEMDPLLRRIRITDGGDQTGRWVFARPDGISPQLMIREVVMVYSEEAILENTSFFVVSVPWPAGEKDLNSRLKSYLNEYKLLSKQYVIKYEQTELP